MTSIIRCPRCDGFADNRCSLCKGAGVVTLDVREVNGCDACPAGANTVCEETTYWACQTTPPDRPWVEGNTPTVAPDWCPLRKGPVTLRLKEGA